MSGGAITLRLSLAGQETVMQGLAALGPAGARAMREIQRAQREPTQGMKALNTASQEVQQGLAGVAQRGGPAAAVLGQLGPLGAAAAVGIGALVAATAVAIRQTRDAMVFADEIQDASVKVGMAVEPLQAWRFAVSETGGTIADADNALASFRKTLGDAQSNLSSKDMKVFKALGFTEAEVKQARDVEAFLKQVIARISEIESSSKRVAFAEKLGLAGMMGLIEAGPAKIEALIQAARDLGVVMDEELVRKGADAQGKFEVLSQVLKVQLASAFVELAPLITAMMQGLVDAAKGAQQFATDVGDTAEGLRIMLDPLGDAVNLLGQYAAIGNSGGLSAVIELTGADKVIGDLERILQLANLLSVSGIIKSLLGAARARGAAGDPTYGLGGSLGGISGAGGLFPREGSDPEIPVDPKNAGGKRGPTAAELAARREELELQNALNIAELKGFTELIRLLKEELEYRRQVKAFKDAGLSEAEARGEASAQVARTRAAEQEKRNREEIAKLEADAIERAKKASKEYLEAKRQGEQRLLAAAEERLAIELEIARVAGNEAEAERLERALREAARIRELMSRGVSAKEAAAQAAMEGEDHFWAGQTENLASVLKAGVKAAFDGNLQQFFEDWFAEALQNAWEQAIDIIAPILIDLARDMAETMFGSTGGTGGADWMSTAFQAFSSVFGGSGGGSTPTQHFPGRASGGDAAGYVTVGEKGPERVWLPPGSFVQDNLRTRWAQERERFERLRASPGHLIAAQVQRMMLDRATSPAAMAPVAVPMPAAPAPSQPAKVVINNHTGQPIRGEGRTDANGVTHFDLYPALQQGLQKAGRDGTLDRAFRKTPKTRRR